MNKKNILIIEDDSDMNALYIKILGEEYNLLITSDALEGRKKLIENNIDLIILDLMLPNESGSHFLSELKKDPKDMNIQVLVVTTFEDIWNSIKGSHPDVSCVLKPFDKKVLLDAIGKKIRKQNNKEI